MAGAGRLRFETFELDLESGELWNSGSKVKLAPKPVRVLALLAGASGRLVTRDAIRAQIWESGTFVDFEHGLNFCIREIRSALGDNAQQPRFVETLPRRGYRFIAGASHVAGEKIPAASTETQRIAANEHYLRARKSLERLDIGGLEDARQGFEQALALDPDYAMAHSGLGAAYSMRTLNRRDPEDLEKARSHLTMAIELDSELAEPYPWLCYLYIRLGRPDLAIETGRHAVYLQPNLVQAQYFLGLAYFAACERDISNSQPAVNHLLQATRTGPNWQPSWFVLSQAALVNGAYSHAREFSERLLELSGRGLGVPFIGAELTLASVSMREGRRAEAHATLVAFLARLETSDHMYRASMSAAAACLLGDIELRDGHAAAALAAYRSGWQTIQEHTRIVAHQRISARAQSGLAAAYATLQDRERAAELLEKAASLVSQSEESSHNAAGASLDEVYWSLAVACMRLQDRCRALAMLARAVDAGFRDGCWFAKDPEWASLRSEPEFQVLADRIARTPKVEFSGVVAARTGGS
jgi:DNA-binding winged helix-turn-helix (wHTH) protein